MSALLLHLVALMGGISVEHVAVTAGPVDIATSWHTVALRHVLTAQTGNPRLILYVRNLDALGVERRHVVQELPRVLPAGSVEAIVIDKRGTSYPLQHTGYSFYRGMPGLVLERDGVPRGTTFFQLELKATVPIRNVYMVWLDSLGSARPE